MLKWLHFLQQVIRKSSVVCVADILSFARFMHRHRCLEVMLFWKEVEQYRSLFSERASAAWRIMRQYLDEGATWQACHAPTRAPTHTHSP